MNPRFRELDGLRALAAFAVVVSHFTGAYNSRYVNDPAPAFDFPQGAFGVQLFFLISGFVILMSASRAQKPSDFVISRAARLYPAYWLSLIIAVVLNRLFQIPHSEMSTGETFINLTMVQRWFQVPNVVDVYWTLTVEIQFYVLMFLMLLLTRCRLSDRLIWHVSMIWLVAALAVAFWAGPFSRGVDPQNVVTPVKLVLNISLAEYGPLFCCGMFAYLSRRDGRRYVMTFVAGVTSIVVAGLLHSWFDAAIVAGICVAFIVIVLQKRTSWLLLPPLQWFGKISYSMYIVHSISGYVVIKLTWPFVGREWAMVVAFVATTLLAWACYIIGEKHASAVLRRVLIQINERGVRSRRPNSASE